MDLTPQQIIELINNSKSYIEVFTDLSNYNTTFVNYIRMIHPDHCKEEGSKEASSKLLSFKSEIEKGKTHEDDCGKITYFPFYCVIEGEERLLRLSIKNYNILMSFKDKKGENLKKYLPKSMEMLEKEKLKVTFNERSIPLSSLGTLPQEHGNWLLSRMLEFIALLRGLGYCHNGINLDSVYLSPNIHGIQIVSFYHMCKVNSPLKTISGKYKSLYPYDVFVKKKSVPSIDIELCKRIICIILGDSTGGINLRKTHNKDFVNFLLTYDKREPFDVFRNYRDLLNKNFKKQFHILNI